MTGPVTGPGARHVDVDALADLLVGGGQQRDVAHVTTCVVCSSRLAELDDAASRVGADLARSAAQPVPPPPADLGERLRAALERSDAPEQRQPVARPGALEEPAAEQDRAAPGAAARQSEPLPRALPPGPARRSERRRPGAALPVAASVVALLAVVGLGIGVTRAGGGSDSSDTAASAGGGTASTPGDGAAAAAAPAPRAAPVLRATGTDYSRDPQALRAAVAALTGPPQRSSDPVPQVGPLARLRDPAALAACLDALGPPPPTAVDLARFEGRPAVLVVRPGSGVRAAVEVVALAPSCRAGAAGVLFRTELPD